jgi:hypothetical protein
MAVEGQARPSSSPSQRERRDAHAARRRMRSPMRSTARLIAAYACAPCARVRTKPDGDNVTVTEQATVSHGPFRLPGRRTTRAPWTWCVCWARAANTLYSAYVRACALLESSSPMTSIRMGSISLPQRQAPGHLRQAISGAQIGSCLLWPVGRRLERFVRKRTASE